MDSTKSSRKPKWLSKLSKLLRRNKGALSRAQRASTQSAIPSWKPTAVEALLKEVTSALDDVFGPTKRRTIVIPVAQKKTDAVTGVVGKQSLAPADESQATERSQDFSKLEIPSAPPQSSALLGQDDKATETAKIAVDVLAETTQIRTPNLALFRQRTIPLLLNTDASLKNAGLWEEAYLQLSSNVKHSDLFQKYEPLLADTSSNTSKERAEKVTLQKRMAESVQSRLEVMKSKQWTFQWDRRSVAVWDQAERIVKFVQTFQTLGTGIAQLDPIHAGIPWAGVCALLNLIMGDIIQHQAALDGIEEISSIIAKYLAVEDIYVQSLKDDPSSSTNTAFKESIIRVYSSILLYQVTAVMHFDQSTPTRTFSNITKSVDWAELISTVKQTDADCVALTSVTATTNMSSDISLINKGVLRLDEKWTEISHIVETLGTLQKGFEAKQSENARILSWISDIRVGDIHRQKRDKLGPRHWGSGQWLLSSESYKDWVADPRGKFWLQGSVGTGKTSLASIVINNLVSSGRDQNLAFFYCSSTLAASSTDPTWIFRSLVAQLSATPDGQTIFPIILNRWKSEAKKYTAGSQFTLKDCQELLVALIDLQESTVSTVIVIDGVDECSEPLQLLRSLYDVWNKSPRLKLLVTSRLEVAVKDVFEDIITIRSDLTKTNDDIMKYIERELARKERRNAKVISDRFRFVELQLDLLINPERPIKYRPDFVRMLDSLDAGHGIGALEALRDTYDAIYERNIQGPYSQNIIEKSLKWTLCTKKRMYLRDLAIAISVDEDEAIEGGLILELCSNFLVVDAHGCILLPHLSVREYLEAKIVGGILIYSQEEAYTQAAITCLLHFKYKAERFPVGTWSMPCVNLDGEDGGADAVLGLRVDLDLIRDWPIISPEGLEKSLARRQTEIEMITSKFELHATYSWAYYCQNAMVLPSSQSIRLQELLREFIANDGSSPSFGAWAAGLFNVVKVGAIREASNTEKTVRKERSHNFWGGGFISAVVFVQSNTTCTAKLSGLLIACQYGFTEILKVDSKHGEAQVMLNHEEYPGLLLACDAGYFEILDLPIDKKLARGLLQQEGSGGVLLHVAVYRGLIELVKFLLGYPRGGLQQGKRVPFAGLDVNSKDSYGETPLQLAAFADRLEATNLLLNEDDLEVHARRSDGKTALQISYPGTKVQEALRKDWRYLPSDEKHAEGDPRGIVEEERKARIKEYWEEFRARFRN
ncbi:Ankyrin repeat-containing protein [Glarea lozoyensis ATCC 20868]|uniref:Ankyrin repeat-containing protein n=1 Tax=Glarea lozoyensis (strain ATCC 20868 / MF5171) TaxID=1116229 RepID=S3D5B9_GLAL2|nr:Ankyrin repeat-containing protein [Glarea lozoyensis ATCC 20868]EPE33667.1 Ankyrin repeat-containing protein [Glarea lozoyensis ATCC 20868]